jgi:hypothetical protein
MARKKANKKAEFSQLHFDHLHDITGLGSEEEVYDFIFSGRSTSVKPVWMTVAPQPVEEYWALNQPYVKFCTRLMSLTIPDEGT